MTPQASEHVLFRVDASESIGSGHMVRCLALARELDARGLVPAFASRVIAGMQPITAYPVHRIEGPVSEETSTIRARMAPSTPPRPFRAVILDNYAYGAEWLHTARSLTSRRVVIDDLADRRLPCEVIVNANLGFRREDYRQLTGSKTRLLLGTRYAMLRPAFRASHLTSRSRAASVETILISMGGSDRAGATALAVMAATSALPSAQIHVVLGATDAVFAFEGGRVAVHRAADETTMARLMTRADLAIGAGGTTSWERCALGVPSVIVRLARNQDAVARELDTTGAAVDAGRIESLTVPTLADIVRRLAADTERRDAMSNRARDLVDGRGVERVAHHVDGIRLRRATMADADLLWRWANDPETRAASLRPDPIPYAPHVRWLEERLADPSTELLIGWNGAGLLGQVRFDQGVGGAEVSISTDPAQRGTVGSLLLHTAIRRYGGNTPSLDLTARVKVDNERSRRLFESAGFELVAEAPDLLVYRLERGSGSVAEVSRV